MKSKINSLNKDEEINEYPCLGIFKGTKDFIVLFTADKQGVVVHTITEAWKLGELCNAWKMEMFTKLPKDQNITLSN